MKVSRNYIFGVSLVLFTVFCWVGSSVQKQYIFDNIDYNAPAFTTWFSTSFFSVYILLYIPYFFHRCLAPKKQGFDALSANISSKRCCWIFIREYPENKIAFTETVKLGAVFSIVWLIMVGTFNFSLAHTSVSSNTIISTLSGSFCMVMSFFFLNERITLITIIGVLLTLCGAVAVGLLDQKKHGGSSNTLLGDVLALISAMVYACYTTMMKKLVQDDTRLLTDLYFGFMGAFALFICWPLLVLFHFVGLEPFQFPSWKVIAMLSSNAVINVISDYTWVRSILLTSPLVATIGLGLTIPVAMFADIIVHGATYDAEYYGACAVVILGFLLVNYQTILGIEEKDEERKRSVATGVNEAENPYYRSSGRSA